MDSFRTFESRCAGCSSEIESLSEGHSGVEPLTSWMRFRWASCANGHRIFEELPAEAVGSAPRAPAACSLDASAAGGGQAAAGGADCALFDCT